MAVIYSVDQYRRTPRRTTLRLVQQARPELRVAALVDQAAGSGWATGYLAPLMADEHRREYRALRAWVAAGCDDKKAARGLRMLPYRLRTGREAALSRIEPLRTHWACTDLARLHLAFALTEPPPLEAACDPMPPAAIIGGYLDLLADEVVRAWARSQLAPLLISIDQAAVESEVLQHADDPSVLAAFAQLCLGDVSDTPTVHLLAGLLDAGLDPCRAHDTLNLNMPEDPTLVPELLLDVLDRDLSEPVTRHELRIAATVLDQPRSRWREL